MAPIVIGIHGGCGTLDRSLLTEAQWAEAREHLARSLRAGWSMLAAGGSSVDAVEAAVVVMEDSPHFNAGYGAALNAAGEHELDASIMDGSTLGGGAVCAARRIRNPVKAARAVMERSSSVLIAGTAADDFAAACGLVMVPNSYFTTERRIAALASLKARAEAGTIRMASEAEKHGTVGAVALDRHGNLAAATSTGGFNNKPVGRVGDSPILGAGTYARNGVCAVSGTGQGEIFIRRAAAYDTAARMMYAGQSLQDAANAVIFDTLSSHKIGAGMIACDTSGNVYAPYNTLGMYRGWVTANGELSVATHKDVHCLGQAI
jgi:beta-aspartyl-peptidase (threonine type)